MRILEVIAAERHAKEVIGMARFYGALDVWSGPPGEGDRRSVRMLVPDAARQRLLDGLQSLLETEADARVVICPVDATLPRPDDSQAQNGDGGANSDERPDAKASARGGQRRTREELYTEIAAGARLDGNFLLLVALSTLVAAIGLAENNVAVIIGAMVIAPLLGPIIALAFATSIGDRPLGFESSITAAAGLGLALLFSLAIGWVWPIDLATPEISARTDVTLSGVLLALASGAAAVLSLTTGLSSALVGVMVAVALLPPTTVLGMMLGHGQWELSAGAALLLAVNVVCVLLAAKIVFLVRGVKPRTWLDSDRARQSRAMYLGLWALLLAALVGLVVVRGLWERPATSPANGRASDTVELGDYLNRSSAALLSASSPAPCSPSDSARPGSK
jgi:uncharacterized hydrophobic protein (TIGR00341 family)